LAEGRRLASGVVTGVEPTWLNDLAAYGIYRVAGGAGLVAAKALAVAALAVILVRVSRTTGGWRIPAFCTALALLAMGTRLLLQPATVSYLMLAVTVWLLRREHRADQTGTGSWPGWPLVALFAVWSNVDRWFVLGLATVVLTWLGRGLDERPAGGRYLLVRAGAVLLLVVVCAVNPAHLSGFPLPAELGWSAPTGARSILSPFQRSYFSTAGESPAALAYYPLLGLGLVSFLLLPRWRWERFLPWLGLVVLSGLQVRTVPLFAVVAGPVLAWNLQDYFVRRPRPAARERFTPRVAARALTGGLAVSFLLCAWPGWLQRPPYEPRRWEVERPVAAERAATAVGRGLTDGVWPPGSRTLHLTSETADAFAWFCPEDDGLLDARLAAAADSGADTDDRLREARVGRLVVNAADPGLPSEVFVRLLADPAEWPLLHLDGGLAVFGRRDPARSAVADPYRWRAVDLERLGLRPTEDKKAPASRPAIAARRWWEALWTPAPPPRPADRDEATVLLLAAEVLRRSAPQRHLIAWEAGQLAALAAAAANWAGLNGSADAALRLTLLHPPTPPGWTPGAPLPPVTRETIALKGRVDFARDDAPPGVLYAAVRAARRAAAVNPADANAYLVLGQCYLRLLGTTREREWALRFPQFGHLRRVQASTALNRAVALNPKLAEAHLLLGRLYQQLGCMDLALAHLRAYRDVDRTRPDRPAADPAGRPDPVPDEELTRLAEAIDDQLRKYADESAKARVVDRAAIAARRGLGGKARDLLLESDISAFGAQGMELELELLLRTGRADDVLDWTTPEVMASLGEPQYRRLRSQAAAAVGEYDAADAELAELTKGITVVEPRRVAEVLGQLVGQVVLDEPPAMVSLPHAVWGARQRAVFLARLDDVFRGLAELAEADTVRGLIALEVGDVDRAREWFRSALRFCDDGSAGGGLTFGGELIARDCLVWLDAAAAPDGAGGRRGE
jgi:tetratricopeptide (TPR) repeat protein